MSRGHVDLPDSARARINYNNGRQLWFRAAGVRDRSNRSDRISEFLLWFRRFSDIFHRRPFWV